VLDPPALRFHEIDPGGPELVGLRARLGFGDERLYALGEPVLSPGGSLESAVGRELLDATSAYAEQYAELTRGNGRFVVERHRQSKAKPNRNPGILTLGVR